MRSSDPVKRCAIVALLALACRSGAADDNYARGHGVKIATVSADAEAQIIDAAVHTAFDVEPALSLRMHPRRLPREAGDSGGTPLPTAVVKGLRDRGLVLGTCEPIRTSPRDTPRCASSVAGYIIRPSDVFALGRDTVEINLSAETYGASTGQRPDALRFEKVFQLVKEGSRWRVVREGRMRQ